MNRDRSRHITARIASIQLRSLLVADAIIGLSQRQELVALTSELIDDKEAAAEFRERMIELIKGRFGRNPDTFELSGATDEALKLLDSILGPPDETSGCQKR